MPRKKRSEAVKKEALPSREKVKPGKPLTTGTIVQRVQCPMCGWIRPLNYGFSKRTGEAREVRFDKMDVENAILWRTERLSGAGYGSHDAKIELIEGKGLKNLPDDLKQQIREQCRRILKVLG